ncbi:ABC transporter substrate-binding protein [Acinetobacter sp. MB5]|uniref:ABC transporter substrate-binding protein n=1 Tax=Acinetobacter sp. MB5 TaxID=2069438 RepID=UPI000DD0E963|nr:ABC transporter substrate-binding protein [Acinetobacter sp. MB5]
MKIEKTHLQIGYIPLLDAVAILWAKHKGFFEQVGLEVTLVKEASWASLRDRLAFGILDAAHCLSAMLPASQAGTDQVGIPFKTSLILSQNSAAISLSQKLCHELDISAKDNAGQAAHKLAEILPHRPIRLAQVFGHSLHHYCLREWLAFADPALAQNIKLFTLPPPYMVEAVSTGLIDGFCVGEPWNTQGEVLGKTQVVASGLDVVPCVADKVLAVTDDWAKRHPDTLLTIGTALRLAQQDIQQMKDFSELWQMLIHYEIVQFPCSPDTHVERYYKIVSIIQNYVAHSATPKLTDFVWLTTQMNQWDQLGLGETQIQQISQACII